LEKILLQWSHLWVFFPSSFPTLKKMCIQLNQV
jgi:hypothetical protein